MRSFLWLMLRRSPGRMLLAGIGFLLTACALVLLSATTLTVVVQASQIINRNWRPAYDLVVLPPQARLPPGKAIPADLLEGYGGGISIQQYEQIKSLPGIELAAPIAFIGYVQVPIPDIQFTNKPLASGYYRLDWTLTAFDGRHSIVEYRKIILAYYSASCSKINFSAVPPLQQQGLEIQCGNATEPISFVSADTGTFLLAAIDPDAENQLIHLDSSVVQGRILKERDVPHIDPDQPSTPVRGQNQAIIQVPNYDVPMLVQQRLSGQIMLQATFGRIASDSLSLDQVRAMGGNSYLAHLPSEAQIFQGTVPLLQNDPQRFTEALLTWDGHSWQATQNRHGNFLSFRYTPSALTYQPTSPPVGQGSPAYTLVPQGTQGPEVAFRILQPLQIGESGQPPTFRAFYPAEPVGQFNGERLVAQFGNPLNWLPEETYTPPRIILRADAQGHPITPTPLLPTTNPAGYVLQPPLALTTLKVAERMVGQRCISAIRIRVSSVETADSDSWKRIQQVAQLIEQRTSLHVIVTLGSSPQPVLVYVPGVKKGQYGTKQDIAPIGWVEERWIVSGAAIVYLRQLGETRFLLLGAILLVCLGYQMVALSTLVTSRRQEFAILSALGWPPWQPVRMFLAQASLFSLAGGSAGIGVALLVVLLIGASPAWEVVGWTLPAMLGLALISALYPLWQLWQIRPAEILRAGTTITTSGSGRASRATAWVSWLLPGLFSVALRNLARTRVRTGIALGSLCLSAALVTVMVDSTLTLRQILQGTFLGNYVLLQTVVPQLAGAVFTVVLTFLSIADLLLLQVRERLPEIGLLQAVGWRPWAVQRLFVHEGVVLAPLGAIPGVLLAWGMLIARQAIQSIIPVPLLGVGVVLLLLIVAALATLPAVRVISRMQPAETLRAA